jgi:CBS domain containing-hemolysin-like protein
VDPNLEEHAHSEEELRMMLVESEEEGHIASSSHDLIQNVFSFDDREVGHIYTPKHSMSAIDITRDIDAILKYMTHE